VNSEEILLEKSKIRHRLVSRGKNYSWIFRSIEVYKKIDYKKADLLENYYYLMRFIDDVADGQAQLPASFFSEEEYVDTKINFSKTLSNPKDFADYMMMRSFQSAYDLGIDISLETSNILESMLFDSKRKGKFMIFDEQQLDLHYDMLDIKGCISGALKIMGEDSKLTKDILPLGKASRIYYDTRDIREDISQGFVNISKEDLSSFNVNIDDILRNDIKRLMMHRATVGVAKLLEYHRPKDMKFLTKLTLIFGYEHPSKKYFNNVLKHNFYK